MLSFFSKQTPGYSLIPSNAGVGTGAGANAAESPLTRSNFAAVPLPPVTLEGRVGVLEDLVSRMIAEKAPPESALCTFTKDVATGGTGIGAVSVKAIGSIIEKCTYSNKAEYMIWVQSLGHKLTEIMRQLAPITKAESQTQLAIAIRRYLEIPSHLVKPDDIRMLLLNVTAAPDVNGLKSRALPLIREILKYIEHSSDSRNKKGGKRTRRFKIQKRANTKKQPRSV